MHTVCHAATLAGSSGVNGDAFFISPDQHVFMLANGASGAGREGKVLMGQTCVETARQFPCEASDLRPAKYADGLLREINRKLIALSQERDQLIFVTLDIAVWEADMLAVASMGDFPMFYSHGGKSQRVAQSPREYKWMIDVYHIARAQYGNYINALHPMMRSNFTRFVPQVVPRFSVQQLRIHTGDILVLCSDVVSDWIPQKISFIRWIPRG